MRLWAASRPVSNFPDSSKVSPATQAATSAGVSVSRSTRLPSCAGNASGMPSQIDQVVQAFAGQMQAVDAIVRHVDHIVVFGQCPPQVFGQLFLVFDYQNFHGGQEGRSGGGSAMPEQPASGRARGSFGASVPILRRNRFRNRTGRPRKGCGRPDWRAGSIS